MTLAQTYDAAIVGAGHNGLVAAFHLARAGLRTVVLERREIVGGACVTEEFAPGFRASTGAYVLSMLRPAVWRDLRLAERGLQVDGAGPSLHLFANGERLYLHDDLAETRREIDRFSRRDARALEPFEAHLAKLAKLVDPLIDRPPPNFRARRPHELAGLGRLAARAAHQRGSLNGLLWLFATSVTQCLGERFESEVVKSAFGWHAINDSVLGPSSPGTGYVLLHDHAANEAGGGVRTWGFVRGGMGHVTELMAQAAREAGAEIRVEAPVDQVLVSHGRVTGVRLVGGEEVRARRVLSNADPKHTFLELVDPREFPSDFIAGVRNYRCQGTSVKINLAVSDLPRVRGIDGRAPQPYHAGIMEVGGTLADMDAAQDQARIGVPAQAPHIELCVPTVHDPSLAPPGRHIITIDVNSQPYALRDGDWDTIKDTVADRAIGLLAEHMPGLPDSILHRQVLSPLDLERRLGLTGGHALHGDMSFDQLFTLRPVRGHADYRTPIAGLYLCGAGTHPGGGVTGANGRNAAREALRDVRRERRRLHRRAHATPENR